jgi:metallo-beta-lactamase family protein
MVRILGERVIVRAKVFTIGGLSAHADQNGLIEWIGHFKNPKMRVYVIHGEQSVSDEFANIVRQKFGFETQVPSIGDRIAGSGEREAGSGEREAGSEEQGTGWGIHISELVQKTDALRRIMANPGSEIPPPVLERIEDEVISAKAHLDEALQSARGKAKDL